METERVGESSNGFLVRGAKGQLETAPVSKADDFFSSIPNEEVSLTAFYLLISAIYSLPRSLIPPL